MKSAVRKQLLVEEQRGAPFTGGVPQRSERTGGLDGRKGLPLCWSASRATFSRRLILPVASDGLATERSLSRRTIRDTPASVAWRIIRSIFRPFGKHWRSVSAAKPEESPASGVGAGTVSASHVDG